jgi:hypothetical protein
MQGGQAAAAAECRRLGAQGRCCAQACALSGHCDPRHRQGWRALEGPVDSAQRRRRRHIATPDGGILIARNNDSDVVKLMPDGHHTVVYQDTDTGGALSENKMGQLFIVERGLRASIWELAPQHKVLADRYMDGPLDCIGGVLNDLAAASNGGVYFTMGGSTERRAVLRRAQRHAGRRGRAAQRRADEPAHDRNAARRRSI